MHLFIVLILMSSCEDLPTNEDVGRGDGKGVFVVCEGNFMFANASLSYYSPDSDTVENSVFYRANNFKLGDVAQSMVICDSLGYIVVNNSARVDVININTYKWVASIKPLTSPRYICLVNDTVGYITDMYIQQMAIFNPKTFKVTGQINTHGHYTEQMVACNNFVFVNCWSYDKMVLVIDTRLNQVVDSIETGIQPESMAIDKYGKLWVLTDGGYKGNTLGYEKPELLKINTENFEIEHTIYFDLEDSPSELHINGTLDTLSFINGSVWQMAVSGDENPTEIIANSDKLFYSLGIDPVTSDIYVSDAIDYMQPGMVYRFTPQAEPIDTFKVGIVPGMFCFK